MNNLKTFTTHNTLLIIIDYLEVRPNSLISFALLLPKPFILFPLYIDSYILVCQRMERFVSQTLGLRFVARHLLSNVRERKDLSAAVAEARAVQMIEDAIHSIIIKRSIPDWLHFVPRASYWVPPRKT